MSVLSSPSSICATDWKVLCPLSRARRSQLASRMTCALRPPLGGSPHNSRPLDLTAGLASQGRPVRRSLLQLHCPGLTAGQARDSHPGQTHLRGLKWIPVHQGSVSTVLLQGKQPGLT